MCDYFGAVISRRLYSSFAHIFRRMPMNNLNNPPQWNIHPNEDGGNGSKWNYALFVPLMGLAAFRGSEWNRWMGRQNVKLCTWWTVLGVSTLIKAPVQDEGNPESMTACGSCGLELRTTALYFSAINESRIKLNGWIWSKESEKQIKKAKLDYQQKVNDVQKDLEIKYQDLVIENRRTVAHLQIELEKEKNRTLSYRKALISQSQKLVEERKILEHEQNKLKQEIKAVQKSGAAGALYASYLEKEEKWQTKAKCLLNELEDALKERQHIYCSFVAPRKKRLEIEKKLLVKAAINPVAVELGMSDGLKDIFKHDTHCAVWLNNKKHENGRLMWLYLKYWELLVDVKRFKTVEEAMIGK